MKFITYSHPLFDNTFTLAHNDHEAVIIDPCFDCREMIDDLKKLNITPASIVITHGHFDHIFGVPQIVAEYPDIRIWMHKGDDDLYKNINEVMKKHGFDLQTGDMKDYTPFPESNEFTAAKDITVKAIPVPGHTPGSCFIILYENDKPAALFTGDVVYAEGGCGFWEHSDDQKKHNVEMQKFFSLDLPEDLPMFAGHGKTSVYGKEKAIPRTVPGQ